MKKQHYMNNDERQQLFAMRRNRIPVAEIARQLGFCRQTIYNELRLGAYEHERGGFIQIRYSPEKAAVKHQYEQTNKGRPLKIANDREYADYLERLICGTQPDGSTDRRKRYSPAAALATARRGNFKTCICTSTLYSYIEKGIFLHLTNADLWQKSKVKKHRLVQRIAHPELPSINNRPEWINSREEPGHFEMDLIVSCRSGSGAVLTMTERTGRYEVIRKLKNKKAETIRTELAEIKKVLPGIKSISTDNGVEFLQYQDLRATVSCPIYYCHSYAAWEKGTNENHNRIVRRWFPKGTNFGRVTAEEIADCESWMNDYPRKKLGWLTPNEFYRAWSA